MFGYTGKILRLDLTNRKTSVIDTEAYRQWGGGHGIGSALFWDLCQDKTIDGFDERNVITIMTSPLTGTLAPGGGSRTEVQGIGVQSSPIGWFTRSNVGGRFGAMLKFAGWDGIVIEGAADAPIWVDIRNEKIEFHDARPLWGKDTWQSQAEIWKEVCGESGLTAWKEFAQGDAYGMTRQRPAVLTIGPLGEKKGRIASIIHDAGNAAGQGGFGGVWGSKNLKAISVIGTGSVKVADPAALYAARAWAIKNYRPDIDNPKGKSILDRHTYSFAANPGIFYPQKRFKKSRPQACMGCPSGCRERSSDGHGNESGCYDVMWYTAFDVKNQFLRPLAKGIMARIGMSSYSDSIGKKPDSWMAIDLAQKEGINVCELAQGTGYIRALHKMGVLGPGKKISCDLPFDQYGEYGFAEKFLGLISRREGIGDDMAEGFYRAAQRWGRFEEDIASGLLQYSYWGLPDHFYDPRCQPDWGFGSIMSDRDVNEHEFVPLYLMSVQSMLTGGLPAIPAEQAVAIYAEKMKPYDGDPDMLDYTGDNIYSEKMAKTVAWHRHFTRFWKQSVLFCDNILPDIINPIRPDKRGMSGEAEPKFWNAVTGEKITFEEGVKRGRRIWNLDNAIWTLQGRHRDMVQFSEYIYNLRPVIPYSMPGKENGKWKYISTNKSNMDKAKFEEWKTRFYRLEGWDEKTGWPMRKTLAGLDLAHVADELLSKGRLGREG